MFEEFGLEFYIYVEPCQVKFEYELLNHYCKLFGTYMFELPCFKVWFYVLETGLVHAWSFWAQIWSNHEFGEKDLQNLAYMNHWVYFWEIHEFWVKRVCENYILMFINKFSKFMNKPCTNLPLDLHLETQNSVLENQNFWRSLERGICRASEHFVHPVVLQAITARSSDHLDTWANPLYIVDPLEQRNCGSSIDCDHPVLLQGD